MTVLSACMVVVLASGPRADPWIDGPLTVGAAAGWAVVAASQGDADTRCPCRRGDVNALDRPAVDWSAGAAESAADGVAGLSLVLAPLLAAATAPDDAAAGGDALLVAEAAAVTGLLTGAVKRAVARPYPYMHAGEVDPAREADGVNYASFWSGHTAVPMAAAVTFAALYGRRHPQAPARWVAWTLGPALALGAGALQVAAGNHFPSDVAAGAAVGAAVGLAVPWLHDLGD